MSKFEVQNRAVSDVEVEGLLAKLKLPEMRKRAKDDNIDFVLRAVPLSFINRIQSADMATSFPADQGFRL
jgi:hypothetical protein